MPSLELAEVILAVIIGTLAAIVYSLRVLILLERRVASMEANIQKMTSRVLEQESVIKKTISKRGARISSGKRGKKR
jgi:predicted Holliday junction resolvase-like endonuclease